MANTITARLDMENTTAPGFEFRLKEILEKVADDNYRDAMTHAIPIVKNASVMDW
ncbi:MAG: hypothetical protein AABZ12_09385 [Planctomycetota bacterium]